MKPIWAGVTGFIAGGVVCLTGVLLAKPATEILGPPKVTVINATGDDIANVMISLGTIQRKVPDLNDGQAVTVSIQGRFGEASPHIAWIDSSGEHEDTADEYMESYGFYHAKVILMPGGKARAIHGTSDLK